MEVIQTASGGNYHRDTWGVSRVIVGRAVVLEELEEWAARAVTNAQKMEGWAPPSGAWWEGYRAGIQAATAWALGHCSGIAVLQFQD